MRTIISACLMMFLFVSVCFADENTDQKVYPTWRDMRQRDCPGYQLKGTPGERILAIGGKIVDSGTHRQGYCWDFVNAVYNCAGYQGKLRTAIFGRTENEKGSYLEDMDMIQPGDWIMHINFDYRPKAGITHSAIFVTWKDKGQMKAMTLDYVGEKRCEAGHYSEHTLTKVYCIYRAIPSKEEAAK
ncbi:MAG: hypothetical protein MUP30_01575 [Deltaproteobacteria bacterium]|nr:hypothetical protein [Deltaproteobacteria bacterium]